MFLPPHARSTCGTVHSSISQRNPTYKSNFNPIQSKSKFIAFLYSILFSFLFKLLYYQCPHKIQKEIKLPILFLTKVNTAFLPIRGFTKKNVSHNTMAYLRDYTATQYNKQYSIVCFTVVIFFSSHTHTHHTHTHINTHSLSLSPTHTHPYILTRLSHTNQNFTHHLYSSRSEKQK